MEAIYLEPGEGVAAVEAKLEGSTDREVLLVISGEQPELRNPLKLRLIQRRARDLAKDITIVSPDRKVREAAIAVGLRTKRSAGRYTQSRRGRLDLGGAVQLTAGLAAIAILVAGVALFIIYFVPTATVTLAPPTETVSQVLEITANTGATEPNVANREVPARPIEVLLEASDSLPTTGRKQGGSDAAMGEITLINRTGVRTVIPAGSIVRTRSGVRFRTLADAVLPDEQWASVRTGIVAVEPGPAGNVDRLTIDQFESLAQAVQVTVLNEQPTRGGTSKDVAVASASDRALLKARIIERLKGEAVDRLLELKQENESIYPSTVQLTIADERYQPANVDDPAETLSLQLRALASALAFEGNAVNEVATQSLDEQLGDVQIVPGSLKVAPLEAFEADAERIAFRLRIEAQTTPKVDEAALRHAIRGMGASEAASYLQQQLHLTERPKITIDPAWMGALPYVEQRIAIEVAPRQ